MEAEPAGYLWFNLKSEEIAQIRTFKPTILKLLITKHDEESVSKMPIFAMTAPVITEEQMREERLSFTEEERRLLDDDIAGVVKKELLTTEVTPEAEELVMEALDQIPDDEKEEYLKALACVPHLVTEESPVAAFLRCEHFNSWNAARRLTSYWKTRVLIFGDKAFLPMTMDGALADDLEVLRKHYIKILPKDEFGRATYYLDRVAIPPGTATRESVLRCFFYNYQLMALASPETQIRGAVAIYNSRSYDLYKHYDRILMKRSAAIVSSLPMKLKAARAITGSGSSVLSILFPMFKAILGKHIRHRLFLHAGSNRELIEVLVAHGVDRTGIEPVVMKVDQQNQYLAWLEQTLAAERAGRVHSLAETSAADGQERANKS